MMRGTPFLFILFLIPACASTSAPKMKESAPQRLLEDRSQKADLRELVTHYLVHYIHLKAGLSVERIQRDDSRAIELIAAQDKKEESVFLRVDRLRLFSENALLEPLEAELTLEVRVLDRNGAEIYRKTVTGYHAVFVLFEEGRAILAEGTVKDALKQLIKDPELKGIIAKYRYGALGSIASIFK